MRKGLLFGFTAFALAVVLLAGCGPNAETILRRVRSSEEKLKTVRYSLEHKTKLPRAPIREGKVEKQVIVQSSTGEYDLRTKDFRINFTAAPEAVLSMLKVGEKQFWQIAGNWYEVGEKVKMTSPVSRALSFSQYLKTFKKLEKLGDTKVEGDGVYHLKAVPDMKEIVKQPGVNELLRDPSGKQVRTVDELEEMKVTFDFYVRKKDYFVKKIETRIEARATVDLIELGYAEPGDRMYIETVVVFSDFNEPLRLKEPEKYSPLPEGFTQQG